MRRVDKSEQRRLRRQRRRALAADRDRTADARALADRVLSVAPASGFVSGTTVLSYESLPHEPPTEAINSALVAAGLRVLVPLTLPDLDLDWCVVDDTDRAPLGPMAAADAALVIAPGLAVDQSGTRLGQGGGSYDRALARAAPGTPVWVLLHPGEGPEAGPLPREPHDIGVTGAITADGVHPVG